MKNLDTFLQLSHYLKSYQLYKSFTEMDQRNRHAISKVEYQLERQTQLSPDEEQELTKYREVLNQVDFNNKLLENSFNSYDFSEETVQQSFIDYKLYAFEFIVDTINNSMNEKKFNNKTDIINHVRVAEKVIRKHFVEKFYLVDDIEIIFEKSTEKVLEQLLNWEKAEIKKQKLEVKN